MALILVAFGVLKHQGQEIQRSRHDQTLRTCREANARHAAAIPALAQLVAASPTHSRAEYAARREALMALTLHPAPQPKTPAGRFELQQINRFIEIIAPSYDCARRAKEVTKT